MAKRSPVVKSPRSTAKPNVKIGSSNPTVKQLEAQIAELQRQAEELRQAEIGEVVARIKEAIAHYGLTAADLGLSGSTGRRRGRGAPSGKIKYRDGAGNTWSGHGRRPQWYIDALAAGKTQADLLA